MRGARRILFAALAWTLHRAARLPLGLANAIEAAADRCEQLATKGGDDAR